MPRKNNLVFLEDSHTYLYNGVIIPSVSELIRFKYPQTYKDVPKFVLEKAASYGTAMHQLIEDYENGKAVDDIMFDPNIDPNMKSSLKDYIEIKLKYILYPKSTEQIISYKGRFAGRYDILTKDDYLIDVKTTSSVHTDLLSLQLGLYYLALNKEKEVGYVIWLPKKKKGELKEIKVWTHKECLDLLKEYEKEHTVEGLPFM